LAASTGTLSGTTTASSTTPTDTLPWLSGTQDPAERQHPAVELGSLAPAMFPASDWPKSPVGGHRPATASLAEPPNAQGMQCAVLRWEHVFISMQTRQSCAVHSSKLLNIQNKRELGAHCILVNCVLLCARTWLVVELAHMANRQTPCSTLRTAASTHHHSLHCHQPPCPS
jgi:hypothetical protein